jgi:hypothetical protein
VGIGPLLLGLNVLMFDERIKGKEESEAWIGISIPATQPH